MNTAFDLNRPIYLQIIESFKKRLASGELQPGSRIASVREFAIQYGVNPNTMQKALSELERAGLLYTERTAGRCVTDDAEMLRRLKEEELEIITRHFVEHMTALGVPRGELAQRVADYVTGCRCPPPL